MLEEKKWYKKIDIDTACIVSSFVLGIIVGLSVPGNSDLSSTYRPFSSVIGWTYVIAWTISFYPQVIMNYQRQCTIGLSSDMILYDCIGYIALSVYSVGMYADPYIRSEYRDKHSDNDPNVAINDVFFATHGILLTIVPLVQMAYYDGWKQYPTRGCLYTVVSLFIVIFLYLFIILTNLLDGEIFTLYYWVYSLAFVKLGVTILKYIPQIYLNFVRQSTEGWNITQILLDLMGGLLSALQLVLDAADMNEWNGVVGNVQKLLLGALTVIFDSIFIFQHYVLYKGQSPRSLSIIDSASSQWAKRDSRYETLLGHNDYEVEDED